METPQTYRRFDIHVDGIRNTYLSWEYNGVGHTASIENEYVGGRGLWGQTVSDIGGRGSYMPPGYDYTGSGLLGLQNVDGGGYDGMSINDGIIVHSTMISSTSSVALDGIKYANGVNKVSQLSKTLKPTATVLRSVSWAAPVINVYSNYLIYQQGGMTKGEFFARFGVSAVEFGLSYIPVVGTMLSIGLSAYDVGGGLDSFYERF